MGLNASTLKHPDMKKPAECPHSAAIDYADAYMKAFSKDAAVAGLALMVFMRFQLAISSHGFDKHVDLVNELNGKSKNIYGRAQLVERIANNFKDGLDDKKVLWKFPDNFVRNMLSKLDFVSGPSSFPTDLLAKVNQDPYLLFSKVIVLSDGVVVTDDMAPMVLKYIGTDEDLQAAIESTGIPKVPKKIKVKDVLKKFAQAQAAMCEAVAKANK